MKSGKKKFQKLFLTFSLTEISTDDDGRSDIDWFPAEALLPEKKISVLKLYFQNPIYA